MTSEDESDQPPAPKTNRVRVADVRKMQDVGQNRTVDNILKTAKAMGEIGEDLQRERLAVTKISRYIGPKISPVLSSLDRQAEQSRQMQADWAARDDRMRAQLAEAQEAREEETAARLERELESLRLAGQLVDQQSILINHQAEMVAEQRKQADDARVTRRLDVAVLVVSVLALIATIVVALL